MELSVRCQLLSCSMTTCRGEFASHTRDAMGQLGQTETGRWEADAVTLCIGRSINSRVMRRASAVDELWGAASLAVFHHRCWPAAVSQRSYDCNAMGTWLRVTSRRPIHFKSAAIWGCATRMPQRSDGRRGLD